MNDLFIYIVDDHQLFRAGLRLLLENFPFIGRVKEASNGKEFLDDLGSGTPDVVFMDIEMPVLNGIETTLQALEMDPGLRIIALSMYGEEVYYSKMIAAGALGFIVKNSGIREVEEAIRSVMDGKNYFSQEILSGLLQTFTRKKSPSRSSGLTDREIEILVHICKGLSNKEIADTLFLSKRTVDKHRENILMKTGAKNTAGLVMYAIQSGIIEL